MSKPVPPRAEDGVFAVSGSAIINAPIKQVWDILLDFPKYSEWNPFVRTQVVVDKAGTPLPPSSQTPTEGAFIQMKVHLPATLSETGNVNNTRVRVTFIDHETHRVAWSHVGLPSFLLHSERWQWLIETEDGKTKYETVEVFGGVVAWLVKWLKAAELREAFGAFADGLKKRAEQV